MYYDGQGAARSTTLSFDLTRVLTSNLTIKSCSGAKVTKLDLTILSHYDPETHSDLYSGGLKTNRHKSFKSRALLSAARKRIDQYYIREYYLKVFPGLATRISPNPFLPGLPVEAVDDKFFTSSYRIPLA
jgi:hypothetical protein